MVPDEAVAALALKAGGRVADIGAGSGYLTIPAAKAVGPTGVVRAIDIHQEMLLNRATSPSCPRGRAGLVG